MSAFLDLNDNCVTLSALYNKVTASYVNDATATVTIKDSNGVVIVNAQSMPYVSGSDGVYRTVIVAGTSLGDDGDTVQVEVDAVAGDGSIYHSEDSSVRIMDRGLLG